MLWTRTEQTPAELAAECYDLFYGDRPDVPFFVGMAKEIGGPVLEVGCGTGRVLAPVAASGIDITGIDVSAENLAICRQRLEALAPPGRVTANAVQADMRQFELGRKFRLAMFPFRTLQELLTANDKLDCLRCTRRHLEDGGFVLIDNYNPSLPMLAGPVDIEFQAETERPLSGHRTVRRTDRIVRRDLFAQTQVCEIIYDVTHPDGSSERVVIPYQTSYVFRFELEHLLARCGFEMTALYADYDRAPYGSVYPGELIALARAR